MSKIILKTLLNRTFTCSRQLVEQINIAFGDKNVGHCSLVYSTKPDSIIFAA